MSQKIFGESYRGSAPENYERYFVPAIGAPLALDLVEAAALRPGERVLDVACGTGVVTRLAAERVGSEGTVAGLDVNPGMLGVARSVTPSCMSIDWYEASAEAMPFPDEAFDVVLCQMGLQFIPNKAAALGDMRRTLVLGGRIALNLPGPTPPLMGIFADGLARHINPEVASFVHLVFSLHDADELRGLMNGAGFQRVDVQAETRTLRVPAPKEFLWQYVHSTPMVSAMASASSDQRAALERDVCEKWDEFVDDGALLFSVSMITVTAAK